MAAAQGLSRADALELQLGWMRGAAWPAAARVDALTQVIALRAIMEGESVADAQRALAADDEADDEPAAAARPDDGALPLSALPGDVWAASRTASEVDGESETSSSAGSRATSIASSASCSSVGSAADDADGTDLACRLSGLL